MRGLWTRTRPGAALVVVAALVASAAHAADGTSGTAPYSEYLTYYQWVTDQLSDDAIEGAVPALPTSLYLVDVDEALRYERTEVGGGQAEWLARTEPVYRSHEKVDAVYAMVLVLPLPVGADGLAAWTAHGEGMRVWQGSTTGAAPFVYGGEEVVIKHNQALEMKLLPSLAGAPGEPGKLPSLEGTGYAYTVWTTLVKYDWSYGVRLGAWISFRYRTDASVQAPDAADDRLKAYMVTWIPDLGALAPPYSLRFDVAPPGAP